MNSWTCFKDVTFAYRDASADGGKRPVFKGLNLTVRAGETVAIVGESGSGKSTVGKLLQRLYDPDGGAVTVDGVDVRELDVKDLRAHVARVVARGGS